MKTIDLSGVELNAKFQSAEEKEYFIQFGTLGVFESLLNQAIGSMYPQGLPLPKGKILARIQRQIDTETSKYVLSTELNVEEAEFDLIKSTFQNDNVKFHPGQYRVVSQVIEAIEAVK